MMRQDSSCDVVKSFIQRCHNNIKMNVANMNKNNNLVSKRMLLTHHAYAKLKHRYNNIYKSHINASGRKHKVSFAAILWSFYLSWKWGQTLAGRKKTSRDGRRRWWRWQLIIIKKHTHSDVILHFFTVMSLLISDRLAGERRWGREWLIRAKTLDWIKSRTVPSNRAQSEVYIHSARMSSWFNVIYLVCSPSMLHLPAAGSCCLDIWPLSFSK